MTYKSAKEVRPGVVDAVWDHPELGEITTTCVAGDPETAHLRVFMPDGSLNPNIRPMGRADAGARLAEDAKESALAAISAEAQRRRAAIDPASEETWEGYRRRHADVNEWAARGVTRVLKAKTAAAVGKAFAEAGMGGL